MKQVLVLSAAIEGLTGLAMLTVPAFVTRLLLGGEVAPVAIGLVRIGGAGLLALGIASWPIGAAEWRGPFRGLLTYNLIATALLSYLAIAGDWTGILLWPAVVVHGIITLLLFLARIQEGKGVSTT